MNSIKLQDLKPGDSIKYIRTIAGTQGGKGASLKPCSGKVVQVTRKHVTTDLGKYKDSFTVRELQTGVVKITSPIVKVPKLNRR